MNDTNPAEKQKILIVDDTPMNLSILEEILEENYLISIAQSGTQALNITEKFYPTSSSWTSICQVSTDLKPAAN